MHDAPEWQWAMAAAAGAAPYRFAAAASLQARAFGAFLARPRR
jgi:hypothetical protein